MLNFDKSAKLAPIRIDIAATSVCNFHCSFCYSHAYLMPKQVSPVDMNKGMIMSVLDDLCKMHGRYVLFAGNGEPLLNPYLPEIINLFGRSLKIEILSNGSTLHFIDKCLFGKLHRLTISLNGGNGKSHQKVHGYKGENKFSHIVHEIERLAGYPNAESKIKLNYVVTDDNYDELEDFRELASALGVKTAIRAVSPIGESKVTNHPIQPCYNAFIQPYITSDGEVLICAGAETSMGNIKTEKFKTIWQRPSNIKFRFEATKGNIYSGCSGCANVMVSSKMFHDVYSKIPLMGNKN